MKKLIYTLAFVLSAISSKASYPASELLLDVYGNTAFTIVLDNQYYNRPDYHYRVLNILPGSHYLQVNATSYSPYGYMPAIFSGYINIPAASKVIAKIDRFGRFKVVSIASLCFEPIVYNPPAYPVAMSNYDFNMLRESIESKSFESTRMEIAKQVISQRNISTDQVMDLMNMMTFESSKLDLAKFAFGHTVDKENYFRVNDAFTFESSIRELDHYITNKG